MAALVEVHPHDGVTDVHQGVVHRQVGRRAGEGLNIDINILICDAFVGEDHCGAALRQRLHEMDVVHAFVEAAIGVAAVIGELVAVVEDRLLIVARHAERGITLGVDVVEHRAQRLAHRFGGHGLGGDHDQLASLAFFLVADDGIDVGVRHPEVGSQKDIAVIFVVRAANPRLGKGR